MSQHTHTVCDGCGEEMERGDHGTIEGALEFYGYEEKRRHFHSAKCLARFAEKLHNKRYRYGEQIRITLEELEESK